MGLVETIKKYAGAKREVRIFRTLVDFLDYSDKSDGINDAE